MSTFNINKNVSTSNSQKKFFCLTNGFPVFNFTQSPENDQLTMSVIGFINIRRQYFCGNNKCMWD